MYADEPAVSIAWSGTGTRAFASAASSKATASREFVKSIATRSPRRSPIFAKAFRQRRTSSPKSFHVVEIQAFS